MGDTIGKMNLRLAIIFFLSLTYFFSIGQTKLPIKIFHKQFQSCDGFSTTKRDYVIKLYGDSTIEILYYSSSGGYNNRFLSKTSYSGKYILSTDTIIVNYLTGFTELGSKNTVNYFRPPDNFLFYRSTVFVANDKLIVCTDHLFPDLETSTVSETNLLEYQFVAWRNYCSRKNRKKLPALYNE